MDDFERDMEAAANRPEADDETGITDGEPIAEKKKGGAFRDVLEWIGIVVCAVLAALLVRAFVFEFYQVEGSSMEPTLMEGERVFVNKITYGEDDIQRRDIVVCHYPNRKGTFVKRVIGLPGETIKIEGGTIFIDSVPLEEGYIVYGDSRDMDEVTLKEDQYMVMGDNRAVSLDSRSIGAITGDMILGHATAKVWPIGERERLTEYRE